MPVKNDINNLVLEIQKRLRDKFQVYEVGLVENEFNRKGIRLMYWSKPDT